MNLIFFFFNSKLWFIYRYIRKASSLILIYMIQLNVCKVIALDIRSNVFVTVRENCILSVFLHNNILFYLTSVLKISWIVLIFFLNGKTAFLSINQISNNDCLFSSHKNTINLASSFFKYCIKLTSFIYSIKK